MKKKVFQAKIVNRGPIFRRRPYLILRQVYSGSGNPISDGLSAHALRDGDKLIITNSDAQPAIEVAQDNRPKKLLRRLRTNKDILMLTSLPANKKELEAAQKYIHNRLTYASPGEYRRLLTELGKVNYILMSMPTHTAPDKKRRITKKSG